MELLTSVLGIGREPSDLEWHQVVLRALIIYACGLLLVRFAHKRFMSRNSAIDMVLAIMLGTVLGRAINGSAPFVATVAGVAALVIAHRAISALTWFSATARKLLEGESRDLVRNGQVRDKELARARIALDDLEESLRQQGRVKHASEVELAVLERNGRISVLPRKSG